MKMKTLSPVTKELLIELHKPDGASTKWIGGQKSQIELLDEIGRAGEPIAMRSLAPLLSVTPSAVSRKASEVIDVLLRLVTPNELPWLDQELRLESYGPGFPRLSGAVNVWRLRWYAANPMNTVKFMILLLMIAVSGCTTILFPRDHLPAGIEAFIAKAPVVYLHATDPNPEYAVEGEVEPPPNPKERRLRSAGGCRILGSIRLDDDTRRQLVSALKDGLRVDLPTKRALEPRHALEAKDGTNSVVLLIGFQSRKVVVYRNGIFVCRLQTLGSPEIRFDRALMENGIKKAPVKRGGFFRIITGR